MVIRNGNSGTDATGRTSWVTVGGTVLLLLILTSVFPPGCPISRPDARTLARIELDVLSQATTAFELRHGHRPPTNSIASVRKHLLTLDPHFDFTGVDVDAIGTLDDAERLVFWLGGGFSDSDYGFERSVFFDFDTLHFTDRDADGFPEYVSPLKSVFAYDAITERVSCDFADDELTVKLHRLN